MAQRERDPSSDDNASVQALLAPNEKLLYAARVSLWNYQNNFITIAVAVVICLALIGLSSDSLALWAGDGQGLGGMQRYTVLTTVAQFWATPWSLLVRFAPLIVVLFNVSQVLQGYYSIRLVLTDSRVIVSAGILALQTVDIPLAKIESLRVFQSVGGKMLNYGSIVIHGVGDSMTVVYGIRAPMLFKKRLQEQQSKAAPAA